jgi:hypothetical protein
MTVPIAYQRLAGEAVLLSCHLLRLQLVEPSYHTSHELASHQKQGLETLDSFLLHQMMGCCCLQVVEVHEACFAETIQYASVLLVKTQE